MDLMQIQYDEDLSQNSFFKNLQIEHKLILDTAPLENWIICIPRTATIKPENLIDPNFVLSHILIPNEELPNTHYTNLLGIDIKLSNKYLTNKIESIESIILFEELFYTKGLMRYKVWCLEQPLIENANKTKQMNGIFVCRDLKDAIQLIWNETKSNVILRRIENACEAFVNHHKYSSERENLTKLRCAIEVLYGHCLENLLCINKRLKEKCRNDVHFYKILKIALETYMMNCLYGFLFDTITVCHLDDSEILNRNIRNLSDAHLSQFNIDKKHNDVLTCMRVELLKIQDYSTGIEKLDCIRRALNAASRSKHTNLTVDELIPILVFVIIKSSLTHWVPTLIFLKEFLFNDLTDVYDNGADSFLITTLEAAIVYIKSYTINIGQISFLNDNTIQSNNVQLTQQQQPTKFPTKDVFMSYLIEQILAENESEVLRLLKTGVDEIVIGDEGHRFDDDITTRYKSKSHLCHPLCDCQNYNQKIVDNRPTVNTQNYNGLSAIHVAAKHGQTTILNLLLALEADTSIVDESNWTALHYAAAKGHQNTLLLLLHACIDINAKTFDKCTALHLASLNGHQGCVKALLYYADHMKIKLQINCENKMGDTALHLAAKWGFTEIIETLLEYGINVDAKNRLGHTAVHYSHNSYITKLIQSSFVVIQDEVCSMNDFELVTGETIDGPNQASTILPSPLLTKTEPFRGYIREDLLKPAFDKNSNQQMMNKQTTTDIRKTGNEKVIKALRSGDTKLAYHFLGIKSEFMTNNNNNNQCHPLCNCEQCQIITEDDSNENFHNLSINLNAQNIDDGVTLIHAATLIGDIFLMKYLLDHGASINCRTNEKQTPLHAAILSQNLNAIKLILNLIDDDILNGQDMDGNTALHLVVRSGDIKMVQCLLEHEPLMNLKNYRQQTAMNIAEENLFFNIGKLLETVVVDAQ